MEQNSSPTLEEMFGKRILQIRKEMNLSQKEFDWNNIIGKIDDITFSFKLDSEIEKKS
jgi:transcriptional regulator with XRE-family HTH domain